MPVMRAEIISIGTELLVGSILNTNARFLSRRLADHAVDVYHQTTVGDNMGRIIDCLKTAAERSDILITSGGLGPTQDDVTVRAVARFLGKPLIFHKPTYQYILTRLKKRGLPMTKLIATQCQIPKDSRVFKNRTGTAPGTISRFEWDGQKRWLLVLPGPPQELEPLFFKTWPVLSKLARIKKEHFEIRSVKIAGLLESQVAQKTTDLLKLKPPVTVGIYAKPQEVELKIMAKAASKPKAARLANAIEKKIRGRFGLTVFGLNEESLATVVNKLLRQKKQTLSAAESCTGGLLSSLLTDIPGSSDIYAGGVVAYSDEVKRSKLHLDAKLLNKYGAVSRETAKAMAENVRKLFKTTYGISITGVAGPGGGSKEKPVGLVHIAIAGPKKTTTVKNLFLGDRLTNRRSAALRALDLLRRELLSAQKKNFG